MVSARGFRVRLGDQEHTQARPGALQELVVEDHLELVGAARLGLGVGPGVRPPALGEEVEVEVASAPRWKGRVSGWRLVQRHGVPRVVVVALDARAALQSEPRTRTFEDARDSDIASTVLRESGVEVGEVKATTVRRAHTLQRAEGDLAFLRRLAALHGHAVTVREGRVCWGPPERGRPPVELDPDGLEELEVAVDGTRVPRGLEVRGWDPRRGEVIVGRAEADDVPVLGSGRHVLRALDALGAGVREVGDAGVDDEEVARTLAVAELARLARGVVRGTLRTGLHPDLVCGGRVRVRPVRPGFEVEGLVIGVSHRWGVGGGWSTEARFCSNCLPR